AAYGSTSATLAQENGPERIQGFLVSWNLFQVLGAVPAMGSTLTPDEDKPGAGNVVVISDMMWRSRFGGDRGIVGRAITLNGTSVTVVGVMPASFYFPNRTAEFWRPLALDQAKASRGAHYLGVVARLKPGVTVPRADAEMKTIAERLARDY